MRIRRYLPYIVYVIGFSFFYSILSDLQGSLSAWYSGITEEFFFYSVSEIILHARFTMFYVICQVIAAVITVRNLSLRKLFFLSCVFAFISQSISFFEFRMMKFVGGLFFPLFMLNNLLPYVAPVLLLVLFEKKKSKHKSAAGIDGETTQACYGVDVTNKHKAGAKILGLYTGDWYTLDIILIILVFLSGIPMDPFGLIAYVCGLFNKMAIWSMMLFTLVFLFVPAALCLLVLLLRMFISWPKHIKNKRRLLLLRVFVIVGFAIYLTLPFTPFFPPGLRIYIAGFRKHIEAKADIEAIRGWLGTLKPEDCEVYNITTGDGRKLSSPKDLQKKQWPYVIINIKPRHVRLSLDNDKQPKVRLNWGSGFLGSWGLVVGNENMPTPESDLSRHGEYRQEIRKGAYIWYGIE